MPNDELGTFMNGTAQTAEPNQTPDAPDKKTSKKAKKEKKAKEPKPKRDNIAIINGLTSIAAVRKAIATAIAKKAKSSARPEAVSRYEGEIAAGKAKLASMLEAAKTPKDLLAAGEEPNKVLTAFISEKETEFDNWLTEHEYKVGKSVLKQISNEIPASFYAELPAELHETIVNRFEKNDFRLQAVCKYFNFKAGVEDSSIKLENGKWVLPTAEAASAQ